MAVTGSAPISLSDLKTEFSGPTPHSLTDYYKGGSYVPDTATNTNVPSTGAIDITDFYDAAGNAWALTGETIQDVASDPDNATASVRVNSDGTMDKIEAAVTTQLNSTTDWNTPNGGASGEHALLTMVSGDAPTTGSAIDTWLPVSGSPIWTWNEGTQYSNTSGVARIKIATDISGATILADSGDTTNYTMSATVI